MARDFGPFPSKPMYEVVNRRMQKALAEATASTGFVKAGQGAVTAGTGAQLVIAAYPDGALVDGLWVENPTTETVTLTTNTASTNPRIDRLVMRLDMSAPTIAPFQIVGTPAASPSAPPLVQNSAGYNPLTATTYDMPLVQYRFPGSASAQNPGSIVDERIYLPGRSRIIARSTAPDSSILPGGANQTGVTSGIPELSNFTMSTAGWAHVSATFRAGGSGAAVCKVFIDGVQVGDSAITRSDVTAAVVGAVGLSAGSHSVAMRVEALGGPVTWGSGRLTIIEGVAE